MVKRTELKGSIISDIANGVLKIFDIYRLRSIVSKFVKAKYFEGAEAAEAQFGFNINFGEAARDVNMLDQYVFDNIKGMTDELQENLRQELQRGMLNGESQAQLRTRISSIFKGDNPTRFRYETRMKMIANTEGSRASAMGEYENIKRLNRPNMYKYLIVRKDKRVSPICQALDRKYGSREQGTPALKNFEVTVDGNKISKPHHPFHINCRSHTIFFQKEEKEE